MIQVKSAKEIEIMKKANQIAAEALIVAGNAIKPGMIRSFMILSFQKALSRHRSDTADLQAVPAYL